MTPDLLDEWRRLAEAHLRVGGGLLSPLSVFLVNHSDELLALATRGREAEQRLAETRKALLPFAQIWGINEALGPQEDDGIRRYVAGLWPTMRDAKRAHDLTREPERHTPNCPAAPTKED